MKQTILIILLLIAFTSFGEDRTVAPVQEHAAADGAIKSSWYFQIGNESAKDNYLSTAAFSGTSLGVGGEWSKMFRRHDYRMGMLFDANVGGSSMLNQRHTSRTLDMALNVGWGLFRRWRPGYDWELDLGGRIGAEVGMLYCMSNGNNPVSARGGVDLSALFAVRKKIAIGKVRFVLCDKFSMPLAGLFFAPQYGESYYEIYLGNHTGLLHFGYPGNRCIINNMFKVGFPVGKVLLEAGYSVSYYSTRCNHLITKIAHNSFVAGVSF